MASKLHHLGDFYIDSHMDNPRFGEKDWDEAKKARWTGEPRQAMGPCWWMASNQAVLTIEPIELHRFQQP